MSDGLTLSDLPHPVEETTVHPDALALAADRYAGRTSGDPATVRGDDAQQGLEAYGED